MPDQAPTFGPPDQQLVRQLDELFERLSTVLGLEVYIYCSVSSDGSFAGLHVVRGLSDAQLTTLHHTNFEQTLCGAAASTRQPQLVTDVQRSTDPRTWLAREVGITAYASWPLIADGQLLGTFSFGTRRDTHFSKQALALLESVCDYIALTIWHRQTQRALRESEQRFRTMADSLPLLVWLHDEQGRERFANRTFCEFFGIHEQEALGDGWQSLLHPDDAEAYLAAFHEAVRTRRPFQGEARVKAADGQWHWIVSWGRPRLSETEEFLGYVGASADITQRKQTEQELAAELADNKRLQAISSRLIPADDIQTLYRELLAAAMDIMHANRGTMQAFDERTGELCLLEAKGFAPELREACTRISPDAGTSCAAALQRRKRVTLDFLTDPSVTGTSIAEMHLGAGIRRAQSTPLVTRDGKMVGMMSTHWDYAYEPAERQLQLLDVLARQAADLIQWHKSDQCLHEFNETLEQRVAQRTAELQTQRARLRHLATELTSAEQRERKRLAAMLHDEVQQLLVAVKMHLGQAQSHTGQGPATKAIQQAAQRLDEAVAASRDLTRQLRPPVLYEDGLLPALQWLAEEMAQRHQLRVTVLGDGEALEPRLNDDINALLFECARELLFNVAKYAQVDQATVQLEQAADHLCVVVEDGGCGMDTAALELHGSTEGFGLFSIRERLAALDGSMQIRSNFGQGTRVELKVPVTSETARKGTQPTEPVELASTRVRPPTDGDDGQRTHVLVVDDHPIVRQGIATMLDTHERIRTVGQASDGIEAIEAMERQQPDVVLMDLNMPRMNGIEATRAIHQRWPDVAIIGLSVQGDDATARSMIDAGATAFVPKSGDPNQMIETIEHWANSTQPST